MTHLGCLTLRPFSLQCPADVPSLWLTPWVTPKQGLLYGLEILGVENYRSKWLPGNSQSVAELFDFVCEWCQTGAVVIGPVNRTKLWNRLTSRYSCGGAHFLLALKVGANEQLIVHDPEGCPYLRLSRDQLLEAWTTGFDETGVLQIAPHNTLASYPDIYRRSVYRGLLSRRWARTKSKGGANGLQNLAKVLDDRSIKSSEHASLSLAVPQLGQRLGQLEHFLGSIPGSVHILNWETHLRDLRAGLLSYQVACARLLSVLYSQSRENIAKELRRMARNEQNLDECAERLLHDAERLFN